MKVLGWNINHRLGYGKTKMPTWVKTVVQEKNADVIVLTETSFKVPNWEQEYRELVDRKDYYVLLIL